MLPMDFVNNESFCSNRKENSIKAVFSWSGLDKNWKLLLTPQAPPRCLVREVSFPVITALQLKRKIRNLKASHGRFLQTIMNISLLSVVVMVRILLYNDVDIAEKLPHSNSKLYKPSYYKDYIIISLYFVLTVMVIFKWESREKIIFKISFT